MSNHVPTHNGSTSSRPQYQEHCHRPPPHPFPPGIPPQPQEVPPPHADVDDWFPQDRVDKRVPQLLPVNLEAKSCMMALQRPPTYAIEKFHRFEYIPLWYSQSKVAKPLTRTRPPTRISGTSPKPATT